MTEPAAREPGRPVLPRPRYPLLLALGLLTALAAIRVGVSGDDPEEFLLAFGLVALFTPLKALMIRWLGGRRPYTSAFTASLFSIVVGMAFEAPYGVWVLLLRSTLFTAAIETLPLFALRTLDRPLPLFVLSAYMSVVVHLLSGGFLLMNRSLLLGGALMVAGVGAMWAPLFLRRAAVRNRRR